MNRRQAFRKELGDAGLSQLTAYSGSASLEAQAIVLAMAKMLAICDERAANRLARTRRSKP